MVKHCADSGRTEEAAYETGKVELRDVKKSWLSAKNTFVETFINALGVYKKHCEDLASQRVQIIQQLSPEFPFAADILAQSYNIPLPDNGIFITPDIIFSYKPNSEEGTSSPITSIQPNQPLDIKSDYHGVAAAVELEKLVKPDQSPLPTLKAPIVEPTGPGDVPTSRGLRTRPAKLCPLKTEQLPIKTAEVNRGNYWVFEYRTLDTYGYYVLRCPSDNCSNPVFSKNPLCNNRAEQHFEKCGYPFKGLSHMILHHARAGRRNREVTQSWARKHNRKLLAGDEVHLEKENFAED
ncbi:hypothetical protein TruAng_004299 [Truncatella angustata]|nr:hypothetical protein TruAng_004299 [Truncatella angustata]